MSSPSRALIDAPSASPLLASSASDRIFSPSKKKSCEISSGINSSICCDQFVESELLKMSSCKMLRLSRNLPSSTFQERRTS
jgi:hypothetical protein